MRYLVIIPARGGSKGIPGKNLHPFSGRPLITWSIQDALSSERVDRVLVSTDNEEIAKLARNEGAEVPFLRPGSLALSESPTEPVLLHVLDELAKEDYAPDVVVLLQPTSPYRRPGCIDRAITKFETEKADSLLAVCASDSFFWKDPDQPKASFDYLNRPRRQDIKPVNQWYRENGSIYLMRAALLRKSNNRLGGKIIMFEMDKAESFEIDTPHDLIIAEHLMQADKEMIGISRQPSRETIDAVVFDFDGVLTDNRVYVNQKGVEMVACNRSDGLAFDLFRAAGIPVFILSKEVNPVVTERAKKLKVSVVQNVQDKAKALHELCEEKGFDPTRLIFVGNDVNDLSGLRAVGYPIAVADAHPAVRALACRVLSRKGGETVAREILEDVLGISAENLI